MPEEQKECIVCHKPLEVWQAELKWEMHEECKVCVYCKNPMLTDAVVKAILKGEEPSHLPCRSRAIEEQIAGRQVTITQKHLDYLNSAVLMFKPNLDLNIESNQKVAECSAHAFLIDMTLEEKFFTLKRMEAICAMVSIALSKEKDKKQITIDINTRERQKFQKVQEYREGQVEKKEKKHRVASEKLDPAARAQKKAIAGLMAIGFTEEQAKATLQKSSTKENVQYSAKEVEELEKMLKQKS